MSFRGDLVNQNKIMCVRLFWLSTVSFFLVPKLCFGNAHDSDTLFREVRFTEAKQSFLLHVFPVPKPEFGNRL